MGFGFPILAMLFMVVLYVGIPAGLFYLGFRFVRAMERRSVGSTQQAELSERLLRLEERIEQLAGDVEQAIEARRFDERLLGERANRDEAG
jgi:hypothetical protein